jgi:uncharacterized protein YggU (UPF0235/DUF167 family)
LSEECSRLQNIAILGHYGWIQKQLIELKDQQTKLQPTAKKCAVMQIEEDQIVLYAAVEGKDIEGFAKTEVSKHISQVWKPSIKSYTTTTAAP